MISIDRQVRLLLRAWPRGDRVERGDEILTTTLDLLPPGHRRLPLALVASLLVGGLRARWRLRPPVWAWANYAFQQTMPSRWQRWMLDDLLTRGWCRRMVVRLFALWTVALWIATIVLHLGDPPPSLGDLLGLVMVSSVAGSLVGAVLAPSAWARERRTQILAEHGYDHRGQPDPLLPRKLGLARARRRRRGADNLTTLRRATALGRDMALAGHLEDAVCLLDDTFERAKRVAPDQDWPTWQAGDGLVRALAEQGRVDEAVLIGREVLAGWRAVHGTDHERSLEVSGMLGELLRRAGHVEEGPVERRLRAGQEGDTCR